MARRDAGDAPYARPAAVAGKFYTASQAALRSQVTRMLGGEPDELSGELRGVIVPHAGYVFSGAIAARAFRQVMGRSYDTVVLLGPSHYYRFDGAAVHARGSFQTPLGDVLIDEAFCADLLADPLFHDSPAIHAPEHDIEVQLPFLQEALSGPFSIVPVVMQDFSDANCGRVADGLSEVLAGRSALFVVTTDLAHYPAYEDAVESDQAMVRAIESFEGDEVRRRSDDYMSRSIRSLHCTMCGTGPVIAGMGVARNLGAAGVQTLQYANSGDVPIGGRDQVVGYVASAFVAGSTDGQSRSSQQQSIAQVLGGSADLLGVETQRALLRMARETIERHVQSQAPIPPERYASSGDVAADLRKRRGAFVTLHKGGQLRGCIGHIENDLPLSQVIPHMAIAAATEDPRFRRVMPPELAELDVEISVLTPPRRVMNLDEIEVGRHGLIVRQGRRAGLLLPQVATEQNWNRAQFLAYTCVKAGLQPDAYGDANTVVECFEAQVFSADTVESSTARQDRK